MQAARISETSVDNYFTRQYIPEYKSEPCYFFVPFAAPKKGSFLLALIGSFSPPHLMAVVGQYACLVHLLSLYKPSTSTPLPTSALWCRQYAALKPRPHSLLTHGVSTHNQDKIQPLYHIIDVHCELMLLSQLIETLLAQYVLVRWTLEGTLIVFSSTTLDAANVYMHFICCNEIRIL
jgi:hypothetical protein